MGQALECRVWREPMETRMAIERIAPSRIMGLSGTDLDAFIESDFKIRSGLCPNGHGLLEQVEYGQHCATCGFSTNVRAEQETPQ